MAKKDFNVVTSLVGKGLEREYLLLKDLLNKHDCYVNVYHYTNYAGSNFVRADANIFLEVVMPNVFSLSRENWLIPNPEWWDARNDQFLHKFTKVLCKTKDCYRIWSEKTPGKAVYTGFESRDLYDSTVERENKFLHCPGESEHKNTEAVIEAWSRKNWGYKPLPLTVVTRQQRFQKLCEGVDGVTCLFGKRPEDELKQLMNSHRFHLLPSAYEGYGHALHEGVGCGALVLTTAAPPMNETDGIVPEWLVRTRSSTPRSLAKLNHVNWDDVQMACSKAAMAVDNNSSEFEARQRTAREAFLSSRDLFRQKFLTLVGAT